MLLSLLSLLFCLARWSLCKKKQKVQWKGHEEETVYSDSVWSPCKYTHWHKSQVCKQKVMRTVFRNPQPVIHFLVFFSFFPRCTLSSSQKERGIIPSSRMLSARVRLLLQKKVPPQQLLSAAAPLLHTNSAQSFWATWVRKLCDLWPNLWFLFFITCIYERQFWRINQVVSLFVSGCSSWKKKKKTLRFFCAVSLEY